MRYLCRTGGYDSTYRLLYILYILDEPVTPIYIFQNIDNLNSHYGDNVSTLIQSRNDRELQIINRLYSIIQSITPTPKLLPVKVIKDIVLTTNSIDISTFLFNSGYLRRPICQFTYLLELSNTLAQPLEVGYLGTDKLLSGSPYLVSSNLITTKNPRRMLRLPTHIDPTLLCHRLRFPLGIYGKLELRFLANRYEFWCYILSNTQSCWYGHTPGMPDHNCVQCRYVNRCNSAFTQRKQLYSELVNYF